MKYTVILSYACYCKEVEAATPREALEKAEFDWNKAEREDEHCEVFHASDKGNEYELLYGEEE